VADIVQVLQSYFLNVHITDPHASSPELKHEYGFELTHSLHKDYDAVIIAVPHREYAQLDEAYFISISKPNALIADLKGLYRNKIIQRKYWSL
jgi:UDP-N-acetyl-D-galactosamine dehydrogenase